MARTKSNIGHVAAAVAKLQQARTELHAIDLRTTRGELRDAIRDARISADEALAQCDAAIQADAAALPHTSRRAS